MGSTLDKEFVSQIEATIASLEAEIRHLEQTKKEKKVKLRQYRKALKAVGGNGKEK